MLKNSSSPVNLPIVKNNLTTIVESKVNDVFVFLEIFSQEGGIQSYVKDILQAYTTLTTSRQGEVFLLRDSSEGDNPFEGDRMGFHYLKTSSPWLGRLNLIFSLIVFLWQNQPQRMFCGHINLAPLIQLLCKLKGIPYTVLTYGKEVWEPLAPNQKRALQQADEIWTISRYSRDRLCAANDINHQKVKFLYCAIDGEAFTPGVKSEELITRYGLESAQVLMTVARLWSGDIYKGVDVTIRALPKIIEEFPQVKYLVIGRGDDQPRLAKLAEDLGVAERVIFAGFVATEELVDHYRVADAYIMPSQEGFGIVYLEAMACGIPVLSGDSDGSADPLQDGILGWQVPHRNPEAVAQACLEILRGEDQRCDGRWLREKSLAKFNYTAFKQRLQQLLG